MAAVEKIERPQYGGFWRENLPEWRSQVVLQDSVGLDLKQTFLWSVFVQHYKAQNNYPEDSTFQNNCYNLASTGKLAVFSVCIASLCRAKQTVISFFLRDDFVDKSGLYEKKRFFCASVTNILLLDSALIFKNKWGSRQTFVVFFLIALLFTVASKDNYILGYCSIIIFSLEHIVSVAFLLSQGLLPLRKSIKSSSVLQTHIWSEIEVVFHTATNTQILKCF